MANRSSPALVLSLCLAGSSFTAAWNVPLFVMPGRVVDLGEYAEWAEHGGLHGAGTVDRTLSRWVPSGG